ncbi:hypothetical protein MTR67_027675 [Solanum verrucosum]|uniref:Uncharacterized protein n=1 Tax=Solanum verrucosum TaxID=315347 RepID=A0AAF0R7V3_SOLVR|nr:hypothetical protein MTR67_027675 [Solanum verrucosum]
MVFEKANNFDFINYISNNLLQQQHVPAKQFGWTRFLKKFISSRMTLLPFIVTVVQQ